jgi:hypothetical protein
MDLSIAYGIKLLYKIGFICQVGSLLIFNKRYPSDTRSIIKGQVDFNVERVTGSNRQ